MNSRRFRPSVDQCEARTLLSSIGGLPQGTFNSAGAVGIAVTSYAIPQNADFVSPTGSDSNAGTQSAPWLTLSHALASTPSGGTIVMQSGTYRTGDLSVNRPVTIQAAPNAIVWLNGSLVVSNWTKTGSIWQSTGWKYNFPSDAPSNDINPSYPLAGNRNQVFLNGLPLTLVSSISAVRPGDFYIGSSGGGSRTIYIGSSPTGNTVEAIANLDCLTVNTSNVNILGIGFRDYATAYNAQGAVTYNNPTGLVQNCTFAYDSIYGLAVYAAGVNINQCTFAWNGEEGLTGLEANNATIMNSYFAYNNWRNFAPTWDAAGAKYCTSSDVTFSDDYFVGNYASGVWFDIQSNDCTIANNIFVANQNNGVQYEISSNGIIADNLVVGSLVGISVGGESPYVNVWNNTVTGCTEALVVWDESNTGQDGNASPPYYDVIENNIFSMNSTGGPDVINVFSEASPPTTAAAMDLTFNYNAYYRASTSNPSVLVNWQVKSGQTAYDTLAAFHSATGQEANGLNLTSSPFVSPASGNYSLVVGSPLVNAGAPLPANVAAAIGVAAGVSVNVGSLLMLQD